MRLRTKFVAMTLVATVVPLVMSASRSIRLHEQALDSALLELHRSAASVGAQLVDQHLSRAEGALRATVHDTIAWHDLTEQERQAALWLLFGQFESSGIATLTERGNVAQRAYLAQPSDSQPGHPVLSERDVQEFDQVAPPTESGTAVGAPLRTERGAVLLPLSATEAAEDGQPGMQVSVGLSLESLCSALDKARPSSGTVVLLDGWNRKVCENGRPAALEAAEPSLVSVLGSSSVNAGLYSRNAASGVVKGASASAAHGFCVAVEQPLEISNAASERLRWQAIGWLLVGVVAAAVGGWALGRSILVPLETLTKAARRIGRGELGTDLGLGPRDDEFRDLGDSFNAMSRAIAERDREIQSWNTKLQQRVEQRGRELEEAQQALLRSQRIAGLAVATAGVAHEMNNPLTGVLGLAQVLATRLRRKDGHEGELQMVTSIVDEAKRMRTVLERMESLGAEGEDDRNLRALKLPAILDGVLLAQRQRIERQGVEVDRLWPPELEVLGDSYHLHAVFAELLDNALNAVSVREAGLPRRIGLEAKHHEGWVDVTLSDNGRGIPDEHLDRVFEPFFTTKPDGKGAGLGLSQVYRLVEGMGGSVTIHSQLLAGTSVKVRLPKARSGAVLA
jgi:signal transduction histidine kinase